MADLYLRTLDDDDVQNARSVLQKASDYHGRLQSTSQTMQLEDSEHAVEMEAEWTALRIALVRTLSYSRDCATDKLPGLERRPTRCRRAPLPSSKQLVAKGQSGFSK
jgi:hypothetical protein